MNELKDKRIFIIEDNIMNLSVFSATLRRSGATIFQYAWSAGACGQLLLRLPIDIILLDLMLRDQRSGYAVFEEVRKVPELAHIPVVAVSAAEPSIEIPKAKAIGLNGFIGKPILPRLFPVQIAACIHGEQLWYVPQGNLEDV
ncbi:MAG: response regulator [Anaerolineae bacterium]|nr:response regulator [Anaerolineae bacterium]